MENQCFEEVGIPCIYQLMQKLLPLLNRILAIILLYKGFHKLVVMELCSAIALLQRLLTL